MNLTVKDTNPVFDPLPVNVKVRSSYYPKDKITFNAWMQYVFDSLKTKTK